MMRSRWLVVAAALLWGLSGLFVKLLVTPPAWAGFEPVAVEHLACWRCLFGALSLTVLLRPASLAWHPLMPVLVICFTVMNGLFIAAMALGDVAEASLLQYTAPFWVFLVNVVLLRQAKATRLDLLSLLVAMVGIAVIVLGRWQAQQLYPATLALGAGVAFAGVMLSTSWLKRFDAAWLAFVNQLVAGLVALIWAWNTPWPIGGAWVVLFLFGMVQSALPNWLMSKAMKQLPAHEVALITLLDPLSAPLWAWLITQQFPGAATLLGGSVFLAALLLRYCPHSRANADQNGS
jgi:drug/metabolite transporter, DME family